MLQPEKICLYNQLLAKQISLPVEQPYSQVVAKQFLSLHIVYFLSFIKILRI